MVDTPEGKQPGVRAGPFPLYTGQNIREMTSWGGMLWNNCQVFLPPEHDSVIGLPPSSFTSVVSHIGLGSSGTFCSIFIYFFLHTQKKSFPGEEFIHFLFPSETEILASEKDWI